MSDFINKLILELFPIKNIPYWISAIVVVLIIFAVALAKELPKIIAKKVEQANDYKSSHQLQIESYFRDISGEKLEELFSEWTDALVNMDTFLEFISDVKNLEKLIKNTILYSSDRSLNVISLFMQYIYHKSDNDDGLKGLAYIGLIVSNLKLDFSGYKVTAQTILKIKFTDWNETKNEIERYLVEIEKKIE